MLGEAVPHYRLIERLGGGGMGEVLLDSTDLTGKGVAIGTPAYMSPEQIHEQALDTRAGLFLLGLTLYDMLSGIHPFQRATSADTTSTIPSENPQSLLRHVKGAPVLLDRLFRTCSPRIRVPEPPPRRKCSGNFKFSRTRRDG